MNNQKAMPAPPYPAKNYPGQSYPAQMTPMMPGQPMGGDDIIDLRALFFTLWRGKWIILISILFAAALGFLAISQMVPKYKATAQVMFDIQQSNVVDLNDVVSQQSFDGTKLEDQIYVLQSTTLIERVIDVLNLDRNSEFNPALMIPEETFMDKIWQVVDLPTSVNDLLTSFGILSPPAPPLTPAAQARKTRLDVIENVREGLTLRPLGKSRVIEISFTSVNRNTSARIVNAIAEQYIIDQLEAKLEATRAATSWLSVRVEELRDRVTTSENAVEDARVSLSEATGQTLEVTQQQLESLNGTLSDTRSEISRLTALNDRLRTAIEQKGDLGAISEFRESAIIQDLRAQETGLLSDRISLESTVPEGHPARLRLEQSLTEVRRVLDQEARRIVEASGVDLNSARDQEVILMAEVRELEARALEQSRNQLQLRQLDREAEASRVLYETFLSRLQETTQQEDLQSADARVLSQAETPQFAESAAKKRTLMLATLLGGILGVGVVFLLDRMNNTFRSPDQLEELSGENVLAVLPTLGTRMHRRDIINHLREKPGSSLAEAVRNLRTSILLSNLDRPPKVIMFTSSIPREGKSTTSMLVALTSKQMGKSAIIVDCDLRLPALSRLVAESEEAGPGLMGVLEGTATIGEAIVKDPDTGLHMLMTNPTERHGTINAADVLASHRFQELVTSLSESYDLVVLDTPPAVVVTDARIVSRLVDAVVYAVRWDNTPRGAVEEGLKELKSVNAPIAGMVMTMVNEARAAKYSYDGYGYYKGRYKDYYLS